MTEKKTPEVIEDADLDKTSGGLLLPANNKAREAAARISTSTSPSTSGDTQAVTTKAADGSV